jgi:methionyl-tRNA formyltransferase
MVDHIKKINTYLISSMDLGEPTLQLITKSPLFAPLGLITASGQEHNKLNQKNIVKEAKEVKLPVTFWKNDRQILQLLKTKKPDLLIVAGFGKMLPKEILDLPKYGVLNIHPSVLPKYRGPSPIQQTILNGDREAGVSIMKLTEKMDCGPLLGQVAVKLSGFEDQTVLRNAMASLGSELLADLLPYYISGELKPYEQNDKQASYSKLVTKDDGLILASDTPEIIDRKVRAYYGWPSAFTFLDNLRVQIIRARLDNNKRLIIDKVKPEGRKEMTYSEFRHGYKGELKNLKGKLSDI